VLCGFEQRRELRTKANQAESLEMRTKELEEMLKERMGEIEGLSAQCQREKETARQMSKRADEGEATADFCYDLLKKVKTGLEEALSHGSRPNAGSEETQG